MILLLALGCGAPPTEPPAEPIAAAVATEDPPCHTDLTPGPASEASLYELPAQFVDQGGAARDLSVGRGHPTVIAMFYTSCTSACPMLIGKLRALDDGLSDRAEDDVRYTLVSLDPERDTPAAMASLADLHQLDDRWTLLRGDADATTDVAAILGIKHRARADGTIDHSTVVTLVDGDGRVVVRIEKLGDSFDPLHDAIEEFELE